MNTTTSQLKEWVKKYSGALYDWALRKTGDAHLAADLVQDTFLAAAENAATFEGRSAPKTWLFGILKNKIAAYYRRLLRQPTTLPGDEHLDRFFRPDGSWWPHLRPSPWPDNLEALTNNPDFNQILDRCIAQLPLSMQACIRLKFLEGKRGPDICEELGVSAANYWQLVHRAKIQLRHCLQTNWFDRQ